MPTKSDPPYEYATEPYGCSVLIKFRPRNTGRPWVPIAVRGTAKEASEYINRCRKGD